MTNRPGRSCGRCRGMDHEPPERRERRPRHRGAASKSDPRQGCRPAEYEPELRIPSTFGLTPRELFAHAVELFANGWSHEEIAATLLLPSEALG